MGASIRVLRDILSGRANEVTVKEIVKILDPKWLDLLVFIYSFFFIKKKRQYIK